jgi:hypothetical protein
MQMRIQLFPLMRIRIQLSNNNADPDPQPWNKYLLFELSLDCLFLNIRLHSQFCHLQVLVLHLLEENEVRLSNTLLTRVADLDPDSDVFGPPGSGSGSITKYRTVLDTM